MNAVKVYDKQLKNEYMAHKRNFCCDRIVCKKDAKKKKIIVSLIFASVVLACCSCLSISNSIEQKRKIVSDFSMIRGVALAEPSIETKAMKNGALVNSKYANSFNYGKGRSVVIDAVVPVDINGDNKKDVDLHIAVNSNYDKLSSNQMFALFNIKKGSNLILEGKIKKDISGRPINLVSPKNKLDKKRVVIDGKGSYDYVDMQNLLSIDNCKMKKTLRKDNQQVFNRNFKLMYSR